MKKLLINVADAETHAEKCGERFKYSMTELSHALGAKADACTARQGRNCPSSTQIISSWEPEHRLLNV